MGKVPNPTHGMGSWIIVSKATGKPVMETWDRHTAEAINTDRYTVHTAAGWLASLNRKDPMPDTRPIIRLDVTGAAGSDMSRLIRVLRHLLNNPTEWDDEPPRCSMFVNGGEIITPDPMPLETR